jgi:uncharacterized protein YbjT (DUF2867 family)
MKIVVIGGSGLIGSQVVANLRARDHEVVAASPSTGVNTVTGEGLAAALDGAQAVVDVTNSPSFDEQAVMDFFRTSTGNITSAARAAGVQHFAILSVVGTDRLPASAYFRAKLVQEGLVKESGLPYTIVRATQFFEFVRGIADFGTQGRTVRVPAARFQPMAAKDVAALVATIAAGEPRDGIVDIAGPEAIPMAQLVSRLLGSARDTREVVADASASYFGAAIDDASLVPAGAALMGATRFEDWLKTQVR